MITFEEIDDRLKILGKNRDWLAEVTGRSPRSIGDALAGKAHPSKRSGHLQRALSDAIEAEETRQQAKRFPDPDTLSQHISVTCTAAERQMWDRASRQDHDSLDEWVVDTLNAAADIAQHGLSLVAEEHGEHTTAPPTAGNGKYPLPPRRLRRVDKEQEA
jgi:hypothetical protein